MSTKKIKKVKKNENSVYLLIIMCYCCLNFELMLSYVEVNMAENTETNTKKSRYDILQNDKGQIMMIIQQRNGGPENPLFVYDGSENALLYRCKENAVYFDDIAEGARNPLKLVSEIWVVEINDDEVVREYKVPVRIVKDVKVFM